MIPSTVGFLDKEFKIREKPGLTYQMHREDNLARG